MTKLILKRLKERLHFILFITILNILFGYIYRELFNWKMLAIGDLASWYLTPSDALVDMQSAWTTKGLGGPRSSAPGQAIIEAFLVYLFGNASMAQRIFYLSLLPLSAIAMYAFLSYLKCSNITKIVIPITYAINGITIPFWQGGIYGLTMAHIVFPVTMLYLLKILESGESRFRNVLMLVIPFGILTSLWQHGFVLLLPFIAIFSFVNIAYRRIRAYASRIVLSFSLFSIIFSLLMLPYLITIPYMWKKESIALPPRWDIEQEVEFVRMNFAIDYTVEMFNNFDYFMFLFVMGLFFVNKTKKKHYLNMLLTASLILLFSHLTIQGVTLNWFAQVPYLLLFRSPERIGYMVMWSFLSMTAFFADDVEKWIQKRVRFSKLKFPFLFLFFGLIFSVNLIQLKSNIHPPFDSTVENAARFFSKGMEPSLDDVGEIDPVFDKICLWLSNRRQTEGFFRTLWLPSERFMTNKVLYRYDPWQMSLFGRNPYLDPVGLCLMPLVANKTENFGKLLSYFNVKYLIVPMKEWASGRWYRIALQKHYTGIPRLQLQKFLLSYAPAGDPKGYVDLLNKQKDLSLIVDEADFKIYENKFHVPHISACNKIFLIAYPSSWSHERNETLLTDDDQVAFWSLDNLDEGNKQYLIANNNLIKAAGRDSLEITTANGIHNTFRLYHDYSSPIDFSSSNFVTFYFYGINSGAMFNIIFFTTYGEPRAEHPIVDNHIGWKSFVIPLRKFKIVGNGFSWAKISRIEVDKISARGHGTQGTWYFDRFSLGADPSFYAYPEAIPFQYTSGNFFMTQVPNMLSTLPFFSANQTLLVFEGFQTSEGFDAYMNISDVVVFSEETNSSLYGLMNDKGTHKLRTFLFIYEAESLLSAETSKTRQTIDITVFSDDNQTAFWTLDNLDSGTKHYSISNDNAISYTGTDSLKVNTTNGTHGSFRLWHEHRYDNFSSAESVSLDFHGNHSGATFKIIFFTTYPEPRAEYAFTDNFHGWRRIIVPKNDFSIVGNGFSWAKISRIEIDKISANDEGAWFFDKLSLSKSLDSEYEVRNLVEASWLSNNHGVLLDGREVSKNISIPETSDYRILIRATDGKIVLRIDGRLLNVSKIDSNGNLSWFESEPIHLDYGKHLLSFSDGDNQTLLDQIVIFPIDRKNITFEQTFSPSELTLNWAEISPSEYSVYIRSEKDFLLY